MESRARHRRHRSRSRLVRALFNTYPLLAGVGLTVGENMGGISSAEEEQWAWDTYGLGVSDAMADAENHIILPEIISKEPLPFTSSTTRAHFSNAPSALTECRLIT